MIVSTRKRQSPALFESSQQAEGSSPLKPSISPMKPAAPIAPPSYAGGSFTTASKDYGNFVDSKKIDEIISNMRQLRQQQNTYSLQ